MNLYIVISNTNIFVDNLVDAPMCYLLLHDLEIYVLADDRIVKIICSIIASAENFVDRAF